MRDHARSARRADWGGRTPERAAWTRLVLPLAGQSKLVQAPKRSRTASIRDGLASGARPGGQGEGSRAGRTVSEWPRQPPLPSVPCFPPGQPRPLSHSRACPLRKKLHPPVPVQFHSCSVKRRGQCAPDHEGGIGVQAPPCLAGCVSRILPAPPSEVTWGPPVSRCRR